MPMETLSRLVSNLSETLVYVAIGLVTLIGFFKCIYPVLRNGTLLSRAVIKLEKSATQGENLVWREPRFLGRSLRADWQRFLLNAGQLDLRGMPCDTDEYINEDTVIYKPGHAQLAELIPSLLTSLGILGTFMGMMESLSNLDFSNAAGTIESIPSLLGGMRFAFATSVAGISCSLVFNMLNRVIVGRAFKALDLFDEAFYELAMPRPLDPDVQLMCQRQDDEANLQRAAENVGNMLAGSLEMAVGRAMHPLTISLDNFIKGATQEQVEGVKKIVGQFIQQMNASLDGQMTALADTMRMVNQGQLQTQQNWQRTLQAAELLAADARRIHEASQEIAQRMHNLSQEMLSEQEARANSTAAMGAMGMPLQEEMESLTASLAGMARVVDELTARMDGRTEARPYTEALWEEELPPWTPPVEEERSKGTRKGKKAVGGHSHQGTGLEA